MSVFEWGFARASVRRYTEIVAFTVLSAIYRIEYCANGWWFRFHCNAVTLNENTLFCVRSIEHRLDFFSYFCSIWERSSEQTSVCVVEINQILIQFDNPIIVFTHCIRISKCWSHFQRESTTDKKKAQTIFQSKPSRICISFEHVKSALVIFKLVVSL